jgi:hypothetical protein
MKQTLTTLQVLFFGLLAGPAMLMAVAYILHQTGGFIPVLVDLEEILLLAVLMVGAGSFVASRMVFERQVTEARSKSDVSEQMDAYKTASILRYTLLESPALLAGVLFLLSGSITLLMVGIGILAYMVTVRPSQDGMLMDLGLTIRDLES